MVTRNILFRVYISVKNSRVAYHLSNRIGAIMLTTPFLDSRRTILKPTILGLFLFVSAAVDFSEAAEGIAGDESQDIIKLNPLSDTLEKVAREELHAGYVYNHFDSKLKRRVWSFWQSNGKFQHAFGEGTTLEAWRFAPGISRESALNKLKDINPELAEHLVQSGQMLRFQLDADGKWAINGTTVVLSIYDLESGYRWEKHSYKYIPISHTGGYRWRIHEGKFVPVYY